MTVLFANGRPLLRNGRAILLNTAATPAPPPPAPTAMSQAFTVQNFSSSASLGFIKRGVWFKKGDVPAGQIPALSAGAGQLYGMRTWSDGSLKFARLLLRDTSFAGSESRSYTMTAAAGTMPSGSRAATGNAGLLSALSGRDIKVAFANVKTVVMTNSDYYNPTFGPTGPLGSGAFTASLAAHAAVATRWTLLTTGPVAEIWQGWGMATDNSGGAAAAHLKVNWFVTRWKNADGSTAGLQAAAVPAQDWWSIANKYRLDYDATLQDGATTVLSYPGVQHHYASQWLMAVKSGNNAGSAPWIGATQPTLFAAFDQDYLIATGLCPPIRKANPPAAAAIPAYVPCGNMEHRGNIDGTGEYAGRGVIPQMDADFVKRMDAQALARARVNALAGLGVPYHYRSNRTRQRPGDSAPDTANTPIALLMAPKAASYSDFTAQGMPVAVDAYADGRSPSSTRDGYTDINGGSGPWSGSGDASHAASYCYFMTLVTGDEWLLEAQIDLGNNLAHQSIYGYHNNRQLLLTGSPQQAAAANPSTETRSWSGLLGQWQADNIRSIGWAQLIQGHYYALVPGDHVAFGYSQAQMAHNGDYIAGSLRNLPADYVLAGAYYPPSELGLNSCVAPWQTAIQCAASYAAYLATEDARWKQLGDHTFNWTGRNAAAGRFYALDQYRALDRYKNQGWATNNALLPGEQQPFVQISPTLDASTGVFTMNGAVYWNAVSQAPPPFSNGDLLVFTTETQGSGNGTLLSGTTEGQIVYIRDVQNPAATGGNVYTTASPPFTSFKVSATPGGPALSFTTGGGPNIAWLPQSAANYPVAQSYPYIPIWNNYVPLHLASVMLARQAGNAAATRAMSDGILAFMAPMQPSTYSPYDMIDVVATVISTSNSNSSAVLAAVL